MPSERGLVFSRLDIRTGAYEGILEVQLTPSLHTDASNGGENKQEKQMEPEGKRLGERLLSDLLSIWTRKYKGNLELWLTS